MMDWDDLRHFIALADEGSLSAAARRLRVEHATVARRIAALEASVGVKLVDRRAGRYALTPDGDRIAEYVRRIEAEAFAIERVVHARRELSSIEVSVSAPPVVVSRLIVPHLIMLGETHPHIRMRLLAESRTVSLPRREADLALRLTRPSDHSLVARKIGAVTYRLYGSAEYLATHKEDDFGFIAFDESLDSAPHQVWLKELIGRRSIVLRTNDMTVQCAAAEARVGIAALPSFLGDAAGLQQADPANRSITRDIWLTYHEDLRDNAAIVTVAAFLAECMKKAKA